jgi:hypothetical protein
MSEWKPTIFDKIVRRLSDNINIDTNDNKSVSHEDLQDINNNINLICKSLTINSDDDYEYMTRVSNFKGFIETHLISKINELTGLTYPKYNLESIQFVNTDSELDNSVPLNEFKIFKFHNLVNAAMNLDKFLKVKERKIYNKGKNSSKKIIKKVKDVLFSESTNNIYSYINEDNKADICVAQYYFDEGSIDEIHLEFNQICKEYNDKLALGRNFSTKSYYIINPGVLEIHLKESTPIKLEVEDLKLVREADSPSLDVYIDEFAILQACTESFEEFINNGNILESVREKISKPINYNSYNSEYYATIMEALSLLDATVEDVELFTEKYSNNFYNYQLSQGITESCIEESMKITSREINNIYKNWVHEDNVPLYIQLEAYQILCSILENDEDIYQESSVPNKKDNKKKVIDIKDPNYKEEDPKPLSPKEKEEFKKNPFKGININSIKLYLEGLKSKFKNMSQKEREISRNLDNEFRRFVKGMKDALISDRREAIIKGSVIPSFSKCVKIAILLAGSGIVTQNALVPVIIAIGGFATSKRLTKKERILLLDEIETELEVVDKEISIADSKNQIKKYRALLNYKKDLQRQYQRIRYNVRIGKDILPGSSVGVKSFDNN